MVRFSPTSCLFGPFDTFAVLRLAPLWHYLRIKLVSLIPTSKQLGKVLSQSIRRGQWYSNYDS